MSSPGETPRTGRSPWVTAAAAFATFVVAALVVRLVAHLTGWRHYTLGESLAFAVFMGCLMAAVMPLVDRLTKR